MDALHAEVAAAELALKTFFETKNPSDHHAEYLPLKERFDNAIVALGRASRIAK